jgi:hypothetical protein
MLQTLIDRYGKAAVLTVSPYMPDSSGDIFRWVALIDGQDVPEVDVRLHDEADWRTLLLVVGDEEYELHKWQPSNPRGPKEPAVSSWTLGALQRFTASGGKSR